MSLQNGDDSPGYSESVWTNLVKWLHNKKGYKPEMLKEEEPMAAIRETFRILQGGVNSSITQETPPELTAALTENVFVFSGFKEHHELVEASRLLTDQNGDIKPFNRYLNDVRTLHEEYNKNYLRAEYNFAVRNSQMAVKWKEWEETGDRYLLQYRTAGDDRVRETHAVLDGTTLPMDDPFWDKYLPPLGWNCRCTTVQVRRGKYPESDSKEAVMKGENCTASVKQQIFRFNPGKVMKVFPPKHPYLPKGCGECDRVDLSYNKDSEQCRTCAIIKACWKNESKYTEIPTKNGSLRIHSGHGKNERAENIKVGKYLAEKHGYCIDLLDNPNGVKSADSFNKTLGITQEYKVSNSPTKNSIDRLLRDGKKQANNIVLWVEKGMTLEDLRNGIYDRVNRCLNIESVTVIYNSKDVVYSRTKITDGNFNIKKEDFK